MESDQTSPQKPRPIWVNGGRGSGVLVLVLVVLEVSDVCCCAGSVGGMTRVGVRCVRRIAAAEGGEGREAR